MAVLGKVAGTMLKDNLVRNGVDLIVDGNLMYFDVSNRRVGIGTISPGNALTVNGSVTASNIYINNTTVTALNGNLILSSLTGNINASTLRILNVVDPVNSQDAATKSYVDSAISSNINIENGLISNINANITAANSAISATNANVVAANSAISTINANVTAANSAISTINSNVTAANSAISTINANVTAANSAISATNANVTAANSAISATNANVAAANSAISATNANVAAANSAISSTNSNVTAANSAISTVNANVAAANSAILTLQGQVYSNSNVAAYLPTYSGKITAANANIGNFYISNNTITVTNTDGNINLTPLGNGIIAINSTTALLMPVGNNLTRPASPSAGMTRYNTVSQGLEVWDGNNWVAAGSGGGGSTVIVSDKFTGTGSQTNFTLTQNSTTAGTMVSINGVMQIPDVGYSITGNVLSLSEAALTTDVIEARTITSTSTVTSIYEGNSSIRFGSSSNSYPVTFTIGDNVTALFETANTTVYGNLVVSGNISGNIATGSNTSTTSAGYLGMPQTIVSAANYTVAITDQGKHLYVTTAANVTIPANSSVSFPVGSTIAIIANAGASANISVTSDTMYLGGTGTTGYRTLAAYGMATAVKTTGNVWFISGSGLT